MRYKRLFAGLLALAVVLGTSRPSWAQTSEQEYYKGKVVRLLIGYGSGGYDVLARLIAPYLAKYLGATVIVENQPGAGGLLALSRLYHAPPDGLLVQLINGPSAVLQQLVEPDLERHDLAKVNYLGTVTAAPLVWLVSVNSPVKTPKDAIARNKPIMWPATGAIDALGDSAAFTCEALQLNCKIISGYPGSGEAALAVVKGEMDAIYIADFQANVFVRAGQFRPVATMSRTRSKVFPDAPTIFEATNLAPEQQWLFDFRAGVQELGRLLITPPGVPSARLDFLKEAVRQAINDPGLIADGERTQNPIAFRDADATTRNALAAVAHVTPEQKARVKALLTAGR